jgi:predicted RNA-binding protein with EMAP domain
MAEASQIMFPYREVVEALIKKQGLTDGLWMLSVNFGMQATNVGTNESDLKPSAVVAILSIGLQKTDKENGLTVDAAKVNPKGKAPKHN